MKKILIIVLLSFGYIFGDTVKYQEKNLFYNSVETLTNVELIEIDRGSKKTYFNFRSLQTEKVYSINCNHITVWQDNDGKLKSKGTISFTTDEKKLNTFLKKRNNKMLLVTYQSFEKFINAERSFGKQLPPKPGPALRNSGPILGSFPIAYVIVLTSVLGIFWQIFAIELIKLIFVARNALFEYFIISAVTRSVNKISGHFL